MKTFIAFALLVAAAVAAPAPPSTSDKDAVILKNQYDNAIEGYNFGYETSNGIAQQEEAVLKNRGTENEAIEVRGSYSYPGPDGILYALSYVANENGFQPSAPYLPVAPKV